MEAANDFYSDRPAANLQVAGNMLVERDEFLDVSQRMTYPANTTAINQNKFLVCTVVYGL